MGWGSSRECNYSKRLNMGYHQEREDLSCFPQKSNVTAGKLLAVLCVAIQYVGGGSMEGRLRERRLGVQTKTASELGVLSSRLGKGCLGGVDVKSSSLHLTSLLSSQRPDPCIRIPPPRPPHKIHSAPRMKSGFPPRGPPHKRERCWLQAPEQEGYPCWAAHFY